MDPIDHSLLTEKEKADVIKALQIMEKVSKSELEFAGHVLRELRIKTMFSSFEPAAKYVMNYPSIEQIRYWHELKEMKE